MSDPKERVKCAAHGDSAATFACRHLCDGVSCGYHCSDTDDRDPWPDAWCDHCEAARAREGGWNDASEGEAQIRLQCSTCYEHARERNRRIPPPIVQGQLVTDAATRRNLIDEASRTTKISQAKTEEAFGIGTHERWGADYAKAQFTLGSSQAISVVAEMQVVGTFAKRSNSWLWSWANDSMEPNLYSEIARLRTFGEVRGIATLADPYLESVEEVDGWELTSVARYVLGWDAVYRAPMDRRYLFMLLRNFRRTT